MALEHFHAQLGAAAPAIEPRSRGLPHREGRHRSLASPPRRQGRAGRLGQNAEKQSTAGQHPPPGRQRPDCDGATEAGRLRGVSRLDNNVTTPRGIMSKREPRIILKTDERKIVLEMGLEGKFAAKSTGWDENWVFLEGKKLEFAVKTAAGCSRTCPRSRDRRPNCSDAVFPATETALQLW
jgi:hypothetical protein